jgi:hypothetical protein
VPAARNIIDHGKAATPIVNVAALLLWSSNPHRGATFALVWSHRSASRNPGAQ